ncbi:MAG: hypothetical protein ACR2GH_17100 [Pseudonocardia sp.]
MDVTQVRALAELVRETYSPEQLDPGVSEPTVVELADDSRAVALPREQMFEPYRSLRLIDAAAVGTTLVITFHWDDGQDDGTIYLMPLDGRDVELDLSDDIAVTTFLSHNPEFTLGGSRKAGMQREPRHSAPTCRWCARGRPDAARSSSAPTKAQKSVGAGLPALSTSCMTVFCSCTVAPSRGRGKR